MNQIKWNKIDWNKTHLAQDDYGYTVESWEKMFKKAGIKTDGQGNSKDGKEFTWEEGMKAGLPMKSGMYLVYFKKEKKILYCYYDDENTTPCFWDQEYEDTCFPDAWADVSGENPLK